MRVRCPSPSPAWRPNFTPPAPLTHTGWYLAPLHPDLAELDYDAFTSCRERLVAELDWQGWPAADFSLADNIDDLADHYGEFERREAYAYSVLEPERCLGCVYIEPWTRGAQLAFWVRDEALSREAEVVAAVLGWLEGWPFEEVVVPLRAENSRARAVLSQLGLEPCEGPAGHVSYRPRKSGLV